jgi:hypothetical protein
MSRSYRKPFVVDGYGTHSKKIAKRRANKKVRSYKDVTDGNLYKKVMDPWNICDFRFYDPEGYKNRRK